MVRVVLPEPQVPPTSTVAPYGIPPRVISSNPCIPVMHRSRVY